MPLFDSPTQGRKRLPENCPLLVDIPKNSICIEENGSIIDLGKSVTYIVK
jgi:hypothetical protein